MEAHKMTTDNERTTRWHNEAGKLHRENDLPAIEYVSGSKFYCLHGKPHRENNLPAIEQANGDKYYCLHGKIHRENGPAIEYANGSKLYYLHGKKLTEEEFNDPYPNFSHQTN